MRLCGHTEGGPLNLKFFKIRMMLFCGIRKGTIIFGIKYTRNMLIMKHILQKKMKKADIDGNI